MKCANGAVLRAQICRFVHRKAAEGGYMLIFQRHQQILDILELQRFVTVQQLCDQLYVSGATIRRDLAEMEKQGLITRVRGGAVAADGLKGDKPYLLRSGENREKKLALCRLAQGLVSDGATLLMDASSTAAMLAAMLSGVRGLSVVTNGLKTINALTEHTDAKIYCSGGLLLDASSMWGQTAISTISHYHADLLFFSCKGLDAVCGVTDSSEENAQIKRHMLRSAKKTVLLCDSSKLGRSYFCRICPPDDLDIIVTDAPPPPEFLQAVRCTVLYPGSPLPAV